MRTLFRLLLLVLSDEVAEFSLESSDFCLKLFNDFVGVFRSCGILFAGDFSGDFSAFLIIFAAESNDVLLVPICVVLTGLLVCTLGMEEPLLAFERDAVLYADVCDAGLIDDSLV